MSYLYEILSSVLTDPLHCSLQYRSPQLAKRDISEVLNKYRLNYKLESFGAYKTYIYKKQTFPDDSSPSSPIYSPPPSVFNDGATKELFNLNGTVPVNYKSKWAAPSSSPDSDSIAHSPSFR